MGIGMVIVVAPQDADTVQQQEPSSIVLGSVCSKEGVQLS